MKLKKLNAALGLLSVLFMLAHIGYSIYAYLTFYYNPLLNQITAIPFMVLSCLHAVCGMLVVFTQADGTRMDLYPKMNLRTILQRVSAALILPLLILHINTFSLMKASAEKGQIVFIILLMIAELLFFAAVLIHVAVSLTRGLITLGLLSDIRIQKNLDRVIYAVCAVLYAASVFGVLKGQAAMFFG